MFINYSSPFFVSYTTITEKWSKRKNKLEFKSQISNPNNLEDESPQFPSGYPARCAMDNGVQITLSKTSMLVNWLPTGTLLTFEMIIPTIAGDTQCTPLGNFIMDVTPGGLDLFRPILGVETPKDERYKLCFSDFIHALMYTFVFPAIVGGDRNRRCNGSIPLIIGVICGGLYLLFPNTRYGGECVVT
ncbi:hypothetical protein MKX03_037005 [Papaver bracteatum]|nr:hypothetical protein MKX03_037005 [Papaver bracteatum]